ncbi:hypothetical protein I3843_01G243100 [Carya illinoinensis]|uniref:Serine-rich protein-like protein n=1 Tax=Carya illinoinensis TaxID=32201 RepID=A0A8T1RU73_CARIL|nr:uncharacterized protein LOC122284695 [Carya illinoinensis]KAG2729406.1 hypothetical protein I3760_01G248000 [Carya illinoinensis]KAG6669541.1 hypothetical protein CIPAW_01G251100 [Carya illinoinensis]KAG6734036.1 hypothetical protein I3842_01G252700 [Carya illinoinensis]KAG7998131.1 hypothetical protein I3843_01G243100 [Carya illinoinensis]
MHQMSSSSPRTKSIVQDSDAFQRSFPSRYSSSSSFASSTSTFASRTSTFFSRYSTISKPVNLHGVSPCSPSSSPSVRFSIERPTSPGRSSMISVSKQANNNAVSSSKKKAYCACSPTTHPGSFRCSLHRTSVTRHGHHRGTATYHLNFRRSAMTNSLVRIGGVEGGDLVRRALSALIRPSSHQQRRRAAFQPRPSRLSDMSTAEES